VIHLRYSAFVVSFEQDLKGMDVSYRELWHHKPPGRQGPGLGNKHN